MSELNPLSNINITNKPVSKTDDTFGKPLRDTTHVSESLELISEVVNNLGKETDSKKISNQTPPPTSFIHNIKIDYISVDNSDPKTEPLTVHDTFEQFLDNISVWNPEESFQKLFGNDTRRIFAETTNNYFDKPDGFPDTFIETNDKTGESRFVFEPEKWPSFSYSTHVVSEGPYDLGTITGSVVSDGKLHFNTKDDNGHVRRFSVAKEESVIDDWQIKLGLDDSSLSVIRHNEYEHVQDYQKAYDSTYGVFKEAIAILAKRGQEFQSEGNAVTLIREVLLNDLRLPLQLVYSMVPDQCQSFDACRKNVQDLFKTLTDRSSTVRDVDTREHTTKAYSVALNDDFVHVVKPVMNEEGHSHVDDVIDLSTIVAPFESRAATLFLLLNDQGMVSDYGRILDELQKLIPHHETAGKVYSGSVNEAINDLTPENFRAVMAILTQESGKYGNIKSHFDDFYKTAINSYTTSLTSDSNPEYLHEDFQVMEKFFSKMDQDHPLVKEMVSNVTSLSHYNVIVDVLSSGNYPNASRLFGINQ